MQVLTSKEDQKAVNEFHKLALEGGAPDNGLPGIRSEMSRQPYYAAFVLDPDGNNLEAVNVKK
jgi:predicted lactoylglutathione lyase